MTVEGDDGALARVRREVASAFAPDGPLAAGVAGFAPRDSQRDFALAVLEAIATRGTLVAEAGTGTGKTFAYLVPGLLAGGKLLVSTATRALQDQVCAKDLAELTRALGLRLEVAVLKGRANYVCLHRLARAEREATFASAREAAQLRAVVRFAQHTEVGDLTALDALPEGAAVTPQVTSTRENCLGAECPRFDDCFVYRARRRAQEADVVVVNHHLFLADLAMRDDAIREFLPKADIVVLDEAHQLPRIAADFFGQGWSAAQIGELVRDVRTVGLTAGLADGAPWVALTQAVETALRNLRLALSESGAAIGARIGLDRLTRPARVADALLALEGALDPVQAALEANAGRDPDLDALTPRAEALARAVATWAGFVGQARRPTDDAEPAWPDDPPEAAAGIEVGAAEVRWIALTQHGVQFTATPLAPGATFRRLREQHPQAWVMVSATLTVAGRFDAFLAEIGLSDATTARWDSPFDYPRQGLLYLPQPLPVPNAPDFPERVAAAVWPVIEHSQGRAFVLCSTLRAVDRVAADLRRRIETSGLGLPLLVQGERTRSALLADFRAAGNAVLVGSVSFWEGIDVRGEALSVVAIDKLPFAPPDDPVVQARGRRLQAMGRNPFTEYQLPQAVTLLKQGAGRLIRDERDRGVLMILDERVLSKGYGRTVLASLPAFARTRSLAVVERFLAGEVPGREEAGS